MFVKIILAVLLIVELTTAHKYAGEKDIFHTIISCTILICMTLMMCY